MKMPSSKQGVLYIVSTPIGNLQDMSLRAIEVLKQVDFIAAEDTRHSKALLEQYGISTPLFSVHDHNEDSKLSYLIDLLNGAKNVALISDAGTPLISDPGYKLVSTLRKQGFEIYSVPGACAAIAALSVSGLPTDRFFFEGFLPRKSSLRKQRLTELIEIPATLICYESPHRLVDTLKELDALLGQSRQICLARELTKKFETVLLDTASHVLQHLEQFPEQIKGECVLLVEGKKNQNQEMSFSKKEEKLLLELSSHLPPKTAAALLADYLDISKNQVYQRLLELKV